jgi:LysM repeat protein
MGNQNVTTIVQSGETLGLYSAMYGCTEADIKAANNLNGDKLKTGQSLVIPIGEKRKLPTDESNALDKKLSFFNEKINEAKMKLYDTKLTSEQREKLEDEYLKLVKQKTARDKVATFSKSGNGINLVLTIKDDITVSEFRKLFPECTTNFYEYAKKTNQVEYVNGKGFTANPSTVTLKKGDSFMIKTQEYAKDSGDNFIRSILKTLGKRLDGK